MPVYLINSYDIVNIEEFNNYIPLVKPIFDKYGGEVVVADFDALAIEGKLKSVNTVVKFPTKEEALNFYNDPNYQKAKDIRCKSTANSTVVLVKEWTKND